MKLKMFSFVLLALIPSFLFCQPDAPIVKPIHETRLLSATEDLMKEHGVLNRLLLIYQEISRRINNRLSFPPQTVLTAVKINRDFIENFHVFLEERYVFPYFAKANIYGDLIKNLSKQHMAGKKLTDYMLIHSSQEELKDQVQAMIIAGYMDVYVRMFRPHEARESSELFPAFPDLMSQEEYTKLGELFEKIGTEKFGKNGFENTIAQLTDIEKQLDLYALPELTPQ